MSVNTMSFEQSAAFLTALYEEATGQQPTLQVANTADFTSVGTTLLHNIIVNLFSSPRCFFHRKLFAQKKTDWHGQSVLS